MINLYSGCKYSQEWDQAFKEYLIKNNIKFKENEEINKKDFLIYRINEFCNKNFKLFESFEKSFPDLLSLKLYNDKLEQYNFLEKYKYPVPSWIYIINNNFNVDFPIVQKKREGSSSKNVKLIKNKQEIDHPCILQKYCENEGDYRITVVGDKASGFYRKNRNNDFRASGSGSIQKIELPIIPCQIAYEICKKFNFITMAFDFLLDENEWKIIEFSYTYALNINQKHFNSYFDFKQNKIINNKLNIIDEIIKKILKTKLFI